MIVNNPPETESQMYYQWIPIFWEDRTTSRTYFRNADDRFQNWEWDSYDTEDDTTVGNTISVAASNYMSGFVVPVSSTLIGARWSMYQAYNTAGDAHFQLWTGTGTTLTLRTTDNKTANRSLVTWDTSEISVALMAGSFIVPGLQYVSGTSTTWYGGVTLKLKDNS